MTIGPSIREFSEDDAQGPAVPICIQCAQPLHPLDHFCPNCGSPNSSHATTDPFGQVFATGHLYRQATSSDPSRLKLFGVWMIAGPSTLYFLFITVDAAMSLVRAAVPGFPTLFSSYSDPLNDLWSLTFGFGMLALFGSILWKVTAHYQRHAAAQSQPNNTEVAANDDEIDAEN